MQAQQPPPHVAPGTPGSPAPATDDGATRSTPRNETCRPDSAHTIGALMRRFRARLAVRFGRKLGAAQAPNVYPLF